jgi:Uncharacterized conserved protein
MKESVKKIAERIEKTFDRIETEEATKNAFIMPFIQLLGYDIFDPEEVIPEFTADIGIKKGEKVDYAICHDGEPAILIECKSCRSDLCLNNESQLFRYFHTTRARFSVLTNGIVYKFFTDLEEPNKMDGKPFLEINLRELDKIDYNELAKFSKENFNEESIRDRADVLKCATSIRNVLKEELANPSEELVRLVFRKMDCGGSQFTEKVKEKITPLVKSALETVINDKVKSHLNNALSTTEAKSEEIASATAAPADDSDRGIVTTQDEIDARNIIRAILCQEIPVEDVTMRDAKTYCMILYKDNNRKPLCRLYFNNPEKKSVGLFDGDSEDKVSIADSTELYRFADRLKATLAKYIENPAPSREA